MKRSLAGSLAAALLSTMLPACRSGAPRGAGPAAPTPDSLKPYVGEIRFLRGRADERTLTVKPRERLAGECDMAFRVRAAQFAGDAAQFSLETLGRPRVGGREGRCREIRPGMQLLVAALSPSAPDLASRLDAVLLTPEGYLGSHGVVFDRPPGELPRVIATSDATGPSAEALLGSKVTGWPKVLLAVNPYFHDLSGRVRQESEVEFEAVVGTDGRLHQTRLKTSLSPVHQDQVLAALSRWRYEPARTADGPVAARVFSRLAFRIY